MVWHGLMPTPVPLCSYHLNGVESPLVRVVRGTEYTFNVMVRYKKSGI